jgi:hypothetical protein
MDIGGKTTSRKTTSRLYNVLNKDTVKGIEEDQSLRAYRVVQEMKNLGLTKLVLLDGDGRMIHQILKRNQNIEITVVELDNNVHIAHEFIFPTFIKKVKGNLIDYLDTNTADIEYTYANFCGLGGISKSDLNKFYNILVQNPSHYMLSTGVRGVVEDSKGHVSEFMKKFKDIGYVEITNRGKYTTFGYDPKFSMINEKTLPILKLYEDTKCYMTKPILY